MSRRSYLARKTKAAELGLTITEFLRLSESPGARERRESGAKQKGAAFYVIEKARAAELGLTVAQHRKAKQIRRKCGTPVRTTREDNLIYYYGPGAVDAYNAFRLAQNDTCFCCRRPLNFASDAYRASDAPHMDHCHTTGKLRCILCARCNKVLGHLEEDCGVILHLLATAACFQTFREDGHKYGPGVPVSLRDTLYDNFMLSQLQEIAKARVDTFKNTADPALLRDFEAVARLDSCGVAPTSPIKSRPVLRVVK